MAGTVRDAGGMRVRIEGSGPPVVLVHGALVDGRLWDPVVAELRDRFTCVVPDLGPSRRR